MVSVVTCSPDNSAAASCLSDDDFGGDHFVLLASALVLVATSSVAASSVAASCLAVMILSRRSWWQPVDSILWQQLLVSMTTFLVAVGFSGSLLSCWYRWLPVVTWSLPTPAAASCLGGDVFGGDCLSWPDSSDGFMFCVGLGGDIFRGSALFWQRSCV